MAVAVDDAQWLDAATASLLAFVARRLDTEPVGILAAVRLDGDPVTRSTRRLGGPAAGSFGSAR